MMVVIEINFKNKIRVIVHLALHIYHRYQEGFRYLAQKDPAAS